MASQFEFITEVQDQHFQHFLADKLLKGCMNIEQQTENPSDAIILMRSKHEMVIHYLYERLIAKPGPSWKVAYALGERGFQEKIGNGIFIEIAEKVQRYGNKSTHSDEPDNENYDAELTREALFSLFLTEIRAACRIIDKLPPKPIEEAVPVHAEPVAKLTGDVLVSLVREKNNSGENERYLIAKLTMSNPPDKLIYNWKNAKTREILYRGHLDHFLLPKESDGSKYICVVISEAVEGRLASKAFTDRKPKAKAKPTGKKSYEATSGNATKMSGKAPLDASIKNVVIPMDWPKHVHGLFDSSSGLTHYFVRPNDSFVLNSLEMMDADAYLFRLLKQEGYENIAFVEVMSTECRIYTYDSQSESIFRAKPAAEKKGPQGTLGVKINRTEDKPAARPSIGRRCIRKFSRGEEFIKQFAAEIGQALRNPTQKNAIIMPMSIFGKNGYCGEPVIDTLNEIERVGNHGNVLIFTMPRRDNIIECFEDNRPRLHASWASNVLNSMRSSNIDMVQEAIHQLTELGHIVLADNYQVDEIANLLLRKKIILKSAVLDNIPSAKVYALAELLLTHCMQEESLFPSIPFIKRKEHCIRQLNSLLDKPEVQEELLACSQKLPDVQTGRSKDINPIHLERVYHQNVVRYRNNSVEKEIMKEFDSYVGDEMKNIKSSILSAVKMFEDEQKHLQRKIAAGLKVRDDDIPYMNFRFVGPPGSGKTSIAGITARYLNARGILPTSKVITVNATQLIRSHVGETAQLLREAADRANGGVLIIDEFQGFESAYEGGNVAQDAMRAIVQIINEKRTSLCIIAAGYEADVDHVFKFDDGSYRRFPHTVKFKNYSIDSLMEILSGILEQKERSIAPDALPLVRRVIEADMAVMGNKFGNAGYLKDMLVPHLTESLLMSGEDRNYFTAADVLAAFPDKRNLLMKTDKTADDVLREFDSYIGPEIETIKAEIISAVNMFNFLRQRNNAVAGEAGEHMYPYMNMRFVGPPGVGKTSIAKLTAKYMNAKGILPRDSVEVINATECVESLVGGTKDKLMEAADRANGGILIIDEFHGFENAYQGGNVAKDAMKSIVSIINKYPDTLCIIAAGYEQEVKRVLDFDVGSDRRFPYSIHFSSYSPATLLTILDTFLSKQKMSITPQAKQQLLPIIEREMEVKGDSFGNAGYVSDVLFPRLLRQHLDRHAGDISPQKDIIIDEEDVIGAFPGIARATIDSPKATLPPQNTGNRNRGQRIYHKLPLADFEGIPAPYPLRSYDLKELGKLVDPAILLVNADESFGTAFLIHPKGYAVTCHHVVDGAKSIKVQLISPEGVKEYTCSVENAKPEYDLAVIKLELANSDDVFSYLPMVKPDSPAEKDDAVVLCGYPMGEKLASDVSHEPGTIASIPHDEAGIDFQTLSLGAMHGNSGSPLIALHNGCVVGVLLGSLTQRAEEGLIEEKNCSRPIKYLWSDFFS